MVVVTKMDVVSSSSSWQCCHHCCCHRWHCVVIVTVIIKLFWDNQAKFQWNSTSLRKYNTITSTVRLYNRNFSIYFENSKLKFSHWPTHTQHSASRYFLITHTKHQRLHQSMKQWIMWHRWAGVSNIDKCPASGINSRNDRGIVCKWKI